MRRIILVMLMVCLPLQWGWANVHVAADAAHTASHAHSGEELAAIMLAPIGNVVHSADHQHPHDTGSGPGHEHGDESQHSHHSHYITVLALGVEYAALPACVSTQPVRMAESDSPGCAVFSRIERPKWIIRA